MTDDGDFPTKSRKVPPADDARNYFQEEVVGNKTDAAVIVAGTTKSLIAYAKGGVALSATIIGMLEKTFTVDRNEVSIADVDNTVQFEISIIDNDSGAVASGDITEGTITISRVRAGATTVIVNAATPSKANGRIYYNYTFVNASWATDDSFLVEMAGVSFVIGGTTFYPSLSPWFGFIGDISTIEGKIDVIDAEVGVIDGIVDMIKSAQHAGANVYFVGTGGDNGEDGLTWATRWETMGYAETLVASGDLVLVGNYAVSASVNHAVTNVTWIGCGADSVITGSPSVAAGSKFLNFTVIGNVIGKGLSLDIEGNFVTTTTTLDGITLDTNDCSDSIIRNNVINAIGGSGIASTGANTVENCTIENNKITTDGTNPGIDLTNNAVTDCMISENKLNGIGGGIGIITGTGGNNAVLDNTIANYTTPITLGDATDEQAGNIIPSLIAGSNTLQEDLKDIYDDVIETQSEIASHALEQSTVLSELDSAASGGLSDNSEISSEIASHALEQSTTLSENQSFALEQNAEEGVTQSEVASHSLEQSTQMSENESNAVSHALMDGTEHDVTQSEVASHVVAQSEADSEVLSHALVQDTQEGVTQSEIASTALEQSTVNSEVTSALEERDLDNSDVESELASHALENSLATSELQSKVVSHASETVIEHGVTQSEVASHVVERSTNDSEMQSKIVSHAGEIQGDMEIVLDHIHSEQKVYPTGAAPVALQSGVGAWTLGAFTEIIPNATVGDIFDIHWAVISAIDANEDYEIVLYAVEVEIARLAFTRGGVQVTSYNMSVLTPLLAAGAQIQAKMMDGTGENSCEIKLMYHCY